MLKIRGSVVNQTPKPLLNKVVGQPFSLVIHVEENGTPKDCPFRLKVRALHDPHTVSLG
jgi:hypothetical protein